MFCHHLDEEERDGCFALSSCFVTVSVQWLFLMVPCVIVVFPNHTHLLFVAKYTWYWLTLFFFPGENNVITKTRYANKITVLFLFLITFFVIIITFSVALGSTV